MTIGTILLLPMTLIAATGAFDEAPSDTVRIEAEEGVFDWAVDESSGRLFASSSATDEVIEFDPGTGKERRRISVAGSPGELLIKRKWLVVACRSTRAIAVIDLESNKVSGTIALFGLAPEAFFASRVPNAFVYVRGVAVDGTNQDEVLQVDMDSLAVRHRTNLVASKPGGQACMSTDGKWAALEFGGAFVGGNTVELLRVDEELGTFSRTNSQETLSRRRLNVVGNRFWVLTPKPHALDAIASPASLSGWMRNAKSVFEVSPVIVHPNQNLMAYFRPEQGDGTVTSRTAELVIEPLTVGGQSKVVKPSIVNETANSRLYKALIGAVQPFQPRALADEHPPRLQFDLSGNRIVCSWGRYATVVSLADLPAAGQPMRMDLPSEVRLAAGEELRIRLTGSASSPAPRFLLLAGPTGAQLRDGELTWRPARAESGRQLFRVRLEQGDYREDVTLQVEHGIRSHTLGFTPQGLSIDSQGRRAVCWGVPNLAVAAGDVTKRGPTEYFVIDLASNTVERRERLDYAVNFVHVDEDYLYVGPARTDYFMRSKLRDGGEPERIVVPMPAAAMMRLAPNLIAVTLKDDHRGQDTRVFERDTLRRVDKHSLDVDLARIVALRDELFAVNGKVVEGATGQTLCTLARGNYSLATSFESMRKRPDAPDPRLVMLSRDVPLRSESLRRTVLGRIPFALSWIPPCMVALRVTPAVGGDQLTIEVRDLVPGTVRQSIPLGTRARAPQTDGPAPLLIAFAANRIVVCDGYALFNVPIDPNTFASWPVPLRLKYPRVPVGDVEKTVTFRLESVGGQGRRSYGLLTSAEGLSIDGESGEVTLDLRRFWKSYLSELQKAVAEKTTDMSYFRAKPNAYRELTGMDQPEGTVASALPLSVTVRDEAGTQDRLDFDLIVALPLRPIESIVMRGDEPSAEQTTPRPPSPDKGPPIRPDSPSKEDSAAGLGRAFDRLETKLDQLLEKIEKIEARLPNKAR